MKMIYNPFYSIVYSFALWNFLKNGKLARRAEKLYDWVICKGKGNAIVRTRTNKQRLFCDFSHRLPFYQKVYPLYDRQLAKLCDFLKEKSNRSLNIIDVGANVGDTVLNIGLKEAFYLCIEGNEYYSKLICRNLRSYQYVLERCYLTDAIEKASYSVEIANGTAHLLSSENCGIVSMATLDGIIKHKYDDIHFDLLKIDTDGFDFHVLRGGKEFLKKKIPLVFFEWDNDLWEAQGEKPMDVMSFLAGLGYEKCVLFDNFGNYFDTVNINEMGMLSKYIENTHGEGLPYYYDVLAIHSLMNSELKRGLIDLFRSTN